MKSFIVAALAALASAKHKYPAEDNYICNMCIIAHDFFDQGKTEEVAELFMIHPKLEEIMIPNQPELYGEDARVTCEKLGACQKADIFDMLMAEVPLDLDSHIEIVNSNPNSNWKAGRNDRFEGASFKEIRKMMGTIVDPDWVIRLRERDPHNTDDLPESFDARANWSECESVINHVRDQSNCGSCWAHGTTEALNDRICISSGGSFTTLLSVSDTAACCNGLKCFSFDCDGGQVTTPWTFFMEQGVVTGGDYGQKDVCYDYTMPMCAHHVTSDTLPACDQITTVPPTCDHQCPDDSTRTYADDKHFSTSAYNVPPEVDQIKAEIQAHGTVTAAFTVYEDFLTYKSGVYSHQSGDNLGGHAIKMIGWGTENGEDYWLCVNSWNNTWGDMGTFKIKHGACGINDSIAAGLPGQ